MKGKFMGEVGERLLLAERQSTTLLRLSDVACPYFWWEKYENA